MSGHALILIPEEDGLGLPPHLLSRIAGLPLLYRLVYSCWRAGVERVAIMVPPQTLAEAESHLAQIHTRRGGTLQFFSDWQALWNLTPGGRLDGPRLVLVANVLPIPTFFAEFTHFPVPAGNLALAVAGPPGSGEACALRAEHPLYLATRQDQRVTSLGFYTPPGNCCAVGLVSFSPAAWGDWRSWQAGQQSGKSSPGGPETLLFPYLAEQAQENKVVAVESPPLGLSLVSKHQDLRQVAFRLITATHGSPWGEGFLESSINRELARKILLRIADWPVTPNYVTIINYLLGLFAVGGFLSGTYWGGVAASLFLILVMVLDCLDGLMARVTFRETWQGILLDLYGDTVLNLLIFCGIAIGQYRVTGQKFFLFLLPLIIVGYIWCWRETDPTLGKSREHLEHKIRTRPKESRSPGQQAVNEATSRDFFYLILLLALFDHLDWFIVATGLGSSIFALVLWRQRRGQN